MIESPLAPPPAGSALLREFATHFGLEPVSGRPDSLIALVRAFARLPYENLSKIARAESAGASALDLETPAAIVHGHFRWGTGGTCFSLTAALLNLVRSLGYEAEPILADRPYGLATHCALTVNIGGTRCLLDPGFLILDPLPLVFQERRVVRTGFEDIRLAARGPADRIELSTIEGGRDKPRLTYRTMPAGEEEFLRAWRDSFSWDMMQYPVLTTVRDGRQLYLRGNRLQVRGGGSVSRELIASEELAAVISREFGVSPEIAQPTLERLRARGGRRGPA